LLSELSQQPRKVEPGQVHARLLQGGKEGGLHRIHHHGVQPRSRVLAECRPKPRRLALSARGGDGCEGHHLRVRDA